MKNIKKARDSSLLNNRININNKYSSNNLNDWIFSKLKTKNFTNILDLCCGRGNQTLHFAKKYNKAQIYGLDISKKSLNEINKQGIKNIKTILMDLDSFSNSKLLKNSFFDLIHCSYGLYYAKNYKAVIDKCFSLLKKNGIFIIIGPTDENNKSLFDFIEQIYPIDEYIIFTSRDFMNKDVFPKLKDLFGKANKSYFYNKISYPSSDSLYTYIKSSTMYKKEYDKDIKRIINKYFKNNKQFIITKKAMAVIVKK